MADDTSATLAPAEVWQQWYDAATDAWAKSLLGAAETYPGPFGLYRQWLKGFETTQERQDDSAQAQPGPQAVWQQGLEATTRAWETATATGMNAVRLATRWTETLEESAELLAGQGSVARAALAFAREWYNATSEVWSRAAEDISGSEASPVVGGRFLESYLSYAEIFRQVAQEYFSTFQLATLPDIANIAGLVAALEDKVEHLNGALDDLSTSSAKLISGVQGSGKALGNVERRLDQVQSAVSEQAPVVGRRLDQVDQQLGRVETAAGRLQSAVSEQAPVVGRRLDQLEQKLGRVETAASQLQSSLDRLFTAVEKSADIRKANGKEAPAEERKAGTKRAPTSGQPAEQG